MSINLQELRLAIIGLGYVGLPLAVEFGKKRDVIGFDVNIERINQFQQDIKNGKLPHGIAIDDGVAVVFIDGKPTEVYSTVNNQSAYFLDKNKKINLKEYIKNK